MSDGFPINYSRVALAGVGAFAVYFVFGGLTFAVLPSLAEEFRRYPAIYRSQDAMRDVLPVGIAATLVGMMILATIYAMLYKVGSGIVGGARFGVLIGLFATCAFVLHNYVDLNIGLRLTLMQIPAYLVEWVITGMVIGLIYRPRSR